MIKGWRNDPQWVAYFEKKQETKMQICSERVAARQRAKVEAVVVRSMVSNQRMNCGSVLLVN